MLRWWHLKCLIVLPEARGRGCGAALVASASRMAARQGVPGLYGCFDPERPWLRSFYQGLGFHMLEDSQVLVLGDPGTGASYRLWSEPGSDRGFYASTRGLLGLPEGRLPYALECSA